MTILRQERDESSNRISLLHVPPAVVATTGGSKKDAPGERMYVDHNTATKLKNHVSPLSNTQLIRTTAPQSEQPFAMSA